jgi:hypothetical protein
MKEVIAIIAGVNGAVDSIAVINITDQYFNSVEHCRDALVA